MTNASSTATAPLSLSEYLSTLEASSLVPIPFKPPKYASLVVGSGDIFRTHSRVGDAKNSFYSRAGKYKDGGYVYRQGAILEMVDGAWYILFSVEDGTKREDLPWFRTKEETTYKRNPEFESYNTTPNVRSYITETHTWRVPSQMTVEEYAEWRVAVDRKIRDNA